MPQYSYTCESCGATFECHYSMRRQPKSLPCPKCLVAGARAQRDVAADWKGRHRHGDIWPLHSDAAGINPDQEKEQIAADAALGVPTAYDSEGRAVFTSRSHRKRYCEAHGLFDRDGGYSDPQRRGGRASVAEMADI